MPKHWFLLQDQLQDLQRVLDQDVDGARAILPQLLGEIVLHPKPEGLVSMVWGWCGQVRRRVNTGTAE